MSKEFVDLKLKIICLGKTKSRKQTFKPMGFFETDMYVSQINQQFRYIQGELKDKLIYFMIQIYLACKIMLQINFKDQIC